MWVGDQHRGRCRPIERRREYRLIALDSIQRLTGIEQVIGTSQADSIYGTANADTIIGGAGNDLLSGGAGNDSLYGYSLNDPQDLNLEFIRLLEELTEAKRRYVNPPQTEAFLIVHSRLFRLAVFALRRTLKPWQERGRHMFATDDPETLALKKSTHAGYFTDLHTQGASHATLVQGLDAIAAACAAENIPVCVFIFPVTNGLDPYPLTEVHQLLADLCRQHGWRAYDLLDSYRTYQRKRGANQYFDHLHPTADASRFTAMAMLAFLLKDAALPTVVPAEAARRLQAGPAEDRTFALWVQFPEMPDGSRAGTTP